MRGPLTLRTGQRAVTAGDFERLTLESSTEVARARCLPTARGNGSVRMLVVPQRARRRRGPHSSTSSPSPARCCAGSRDHLDEHRLVGTAIEVGTPYYQGVSVAALVHTAPGRPAAARAPTGDRDA